MATKALPSPEVLRQLLRYEPETGSLFWRERGAEWFRDGTNSADQTRSAWNSRWAGKAALNSLSHQGYRNGGLLGAHCLAHRAIWVMQEGSWPGNAIDHINGDRADNRWPNLRTANHSENGRNMKIRSDNTSGVKGVYWHSRNAKWAAKIKLAGRTIPLGCHDDIDSAAAAYAKASAEFHGAFGRTK